MKIYSPIVLCVVIMVCHALSPSERIRRTPGSPHLTCEFHYQVGSNIFNVDPLKGLKYLMGSGWMSTSLGSITKFLIERKGLSNEMVRKYINDYSSPSLLVDRLLKHFDFSQLTIDEALRQFQGHFLLNVGTDSHKDFINSFVQRYCEFSPQKQLKDCDENMKHMTYATLALNRFLHPSDDSPKTDYSMNNFIQICRKDIPKNVMNDDYLENLYSRIKESAFHLNPDFVSQAERIEAEISGIESIKSKTPRKFIDGLTLDEIANLNSDSTETAEKEVFLFNDLILVTKVVNKKYNFERSFPLQEIKAEKFVHANYPYGIVLKREVDDEKLILFNATSEGDQRQFVEDLTKLIPILRTTISELKRVDDRRTEAATSAESVGTTCERHYQEGSTLFNEDPQKGIKYLIESRWMENSPSSIAKFLMEGNGLSKKMIAKYLVKHSDRLFSGLYTREFEFSGLPLDEELRKLLTHFPITGMEPGKISDIFEDFGQRYCECNPGNKFADCDTLMFQLAYATLQLNTDQHNPKNPKKMSLEEFIKNFRHVDPMKAMSDKDLEGLYYRIKEKEFDGGPDIVTSRI